MMFDFHLEFVFKNGQGQVPWVLRLGSMFCLHKQSMNPVPVA